MTELENTGESQHGLPHSVQSPATLLKACIFSAVLAAIILVSTILQLNTVLTPWASVPQ